MKPFWKFTSCSTIQTLLHKKEDKFISLSAQFDFPIVNSEFDRVSIKWPVEEFIVKVERRLTIEPFHGMGIHHFRQIEPYSVAFWSTLPSWKKYLYYYLKKRRTFHECVIFDFNLGANYFHFHIDVLPKLIVIDNHGLRELPLLIHRRIFETKHFQYYLQFEWVSKRNWTIIEENEYLSIRNAYFVKPLGYHLPYLNFIKALDATARPRGLRKNVFLNRSKKTGRYLLNMDEIKPLLDQYEFEIVETEHMTIKEQHELFAGILCLVSVHGAGNTNIIFSDSSLRFLELMPSNRIASQYYWLSNSLGIDYYDVLLGTEMQPEMNNALTVDPVLFEKHLKNLVGMRD
jgi:hypothetical protein